MKKYILTFLVLLSVLIISCSATSTTEARLPGLNELNSHHPEQFKDEFQKESDLSQYVIDVVDDYINNNDFCFIPNPICGKILQENIDKIGKIMTKYGWDENSCIVQLFLVGTKETNKKHIIIRLIFKSHINDFIYGSTWIINDDTIEAERIVL